ncbi:hypothetical protein ACRWXJ_25190, partial [Escherichia coli]
DVFAGKKSAQIREILINESAWEEMTCLFAPSLTCRTKWLQVFIPISNGKLNGRMYVICSVSPQEPD